MTNPYNDVVGSKVNAYLNAGIMLSWRPDPQWTFTFGLDASHFSNGNTGYPNLGVNVNPMCKVSSFIRAGISLDIQYDESSALEGRFAGVNDQGDIRFYLPPLVEQFTAGLSLRAELVMPVFSVNLGVGYDLYDKNVSRKNFYQVAILTILCLDSAGGSDVQVDFSTINVL